ncbi:MAG: hypothetical protein LKK08_06075 [Bacteroidales bacterium]|jgi:hypothetical protein|nr:hypothetical protein [Bacteroidales bacterium]
MLIGDNTETRDVSRIGDEGVQRIRDFLQGMVYYWCKINGGARFTAKDLVGGDNSIWDNSPLRFLYPDHLTTREISIEVHDQAGKDVGYILKEMLKHDKRTFETEEGFTRSYRWIEQ